MSIRRQLGDLAKSLDSSAVGSFLSKGASEADFTTISYSDVSGAPSVVADSAVATAIIDSAYVQSRVTTVAAGLDSATTINLLDSNYMAARSGGGAGFYVYNYDATAGQTTFQDSDAAGNVMSYSADGIIVFYNGVMLPTADYTADDGTSVVLGSAADSQDVVTIAKWSVGSGSSSSSSLASYGDRGIIMGGNNGTAIQNIIQYFDITSTGNASDFGDLTSIKQTGGAVSNATLALYGGGYSTATISDVDYVTIATTGNASDAGNLTYARYSLGAFSNGTRGVFCGGTDSVNNNTVDYVTIATSVTAADFGDSLVAMRLYGTSSDNTYGIQAGGYTGGQVNTIQYYTIDTAGNATDFGDLTASYYDKQGVYDLTYSVFAGGSPSTDTIDYITTATTGNASDFGDLLSTKRFWMGSGCSNGTRGVFCGGGENATGSNTLQYITIATPSNATDFGDMTVSLSQPGCTSGNAS